VYVSSVMLRALHEERVRDLQRRALQPTRRRHEPGRARSRLALRARTRAGVGKGGLLVAGAKP
jgi:hypothetical protein